jgi:hypothetical protein
MAQNQKIGHTLLTPSGSPNTKKTPYKYSQMAARAHMGSVRE